MLSRLSNFYWKYLYIWVIFIKIFFIISVMLFTPMILITWGKHFSQLLAMSFAGSLVFTLIFRIYILIDNHRTKISTKKCKNQ
jgi:hypothetical protein